MLRPVRYLLVAVATVAAVECAHTSMTSMVAPEVRGRSFHSILVVVQIADLGLRTAMETRFAQGMVTDSTQNVTFPDRSKLRVTRFVPSHRIFFPGREYSGEQVVEAMRRNGIDGTLVVTPGEAGSSQVYVPPTYTTRCTLLTETGCAETTTSPSGSYSYSKPWARFSAKLFDAANGQVVWVASALTGGNAFAQTEDLVRSMADKTVNRLVADKVIQ